MAQASIKDVKAYFEFKSSKDFMKEWKELSDEDKEYFKEAVGEELGE
jgi:mRNA-degrading endonuclease RelE of RelBE toxin-antitoxin system